MRVPAPTARLLIQGKATQVRIPLGTPQRLTDGRRVPAASRYHVGDTVEIYPIDATVLIVQGDDGEPDREYTHRETDPTPLGLVKITAIRQSTLGDLTYDDARREGYPASTWRDDLLNSWKLYRDKNNPDLPVWVLETEPQHDVVRCLTHNGRPVGRQDIRDPERWHGPAGSEVGYTSGHGAIPHEPEAIDVTDLDPRDRQASRSRHQAATDHWHEARQDRTMLVQLREELKAARRSGVDLTKTLATIARELQQIRAARERSRAA